MIGVDVREYMDIKGRRGGLQDWSERVMARLCKAIRKDGVPCAAYALAGSDYCFTHDPSLVTKRAAARRKGGRGKRGKGLVRVLPDGVGNLSLDSAEAVRALLESCIGWALRGELDRHSLHEITYAANATIGALKVSALADRIAALEKRLSKKAAEE